MIEQFDVIVVGGSVSGAPTAIWLARKGFKVLIVEKAIFPRDTNSTHFIWPRGMSYLNRLGVADKILEKTPHFKQLEINLEGIKLHGNVPLQAIKNRFISLHGDDHGVVDYYSGPRRFYLDQILLDEARISGVDVREGTLVESLIFENGKVVGVRGNNRNNVVLEARAKVVIGADGRMSSFANHVKSQKIEVREKSTFAYYTYFTGIDKPELCIHKKGRLGTAIFPTMENRHLVLVYGPAEWWNDFSKNPKKNFFKTYDFVAPDIAEIIKKGTQIEKFKGMGRMVAFHRKTSGKGWVLVGDAGSFKDQWSAMGITHSLRDAELLSIYLERFLKNETTWNKAMSDYTEIRLADYEDYWNMICDGAEMEPYTPEQLKFFHSIKSHQDKVNHFIAQIGDTVKLNQKISLNDVKQCDFPCFIKNFNSKKLGYYQNIYTTTKQ